MQSSEVPGEAIRHHEEIAFPLSKKTRLMGWESVNNPSFRPSKGMRN